MLIHRKKSELEILLSFSWRLSSKESTCQYRRHSSNPGWGRSLEKEMALHSSIPAWEIPSTEEPGGL